MGIADLLLWHWHADCIVCPSLLLPVMAGAADCKLEHFAACACKTSVHEHS